MVQALKNRTISLLWLGQVLSSIGDEIYRVALIWIAVDLIGAKTGYLAAGQAAALLTLSIFGGLWADKWNPLRTMIGVDLVRGVIVLAPVVAHYTFGSSLWVLVPVALTISALGAFFDPALQTALPELCEDPKLLRAANGLMGMTARSARALGPGIVGFFSALIPVIHFFTIDALSFFVSAYSVSSIHKKRKQISVEERREILSEGIFSSLKLIRNTENMSYVMFAKAITSSTWTVAYSLGLALLVTETAAHSVKAFSFVIASYGAGNLGGALYFANIERKRPFFLMYTGYIWLGLGFALIGFAPTLAFVMAAAAFSAIGGPLNDLVFVDLMQNKFQAEDLTKIYRFKIGSETLCNLILMGSAPLFLKFASIHTLFMVCGGTIATMGMVGLLLGENN